MLERATERPWSFGWDDRGMMVVHSANRRIVSQKEIPEDFFGAERERFKRELESNSAITVLAVNSFEALLEAAKAILLKESDMKTGHAYNEYRALEAAIAIAQAEGGA